MPAKLLAALLLAALLPLSVAASAATLAGRVVGPDGQPVEGAVVLCGPSGLPELSSGMPTAAMHAARTNAEGHFAIADLGPGVLDVAVRSLVLEPQRLTGIVILGSGEPPRLQIKLARGSIVEGRVLDGQGKPVPEASVQASSTKGRPGDFMDSIFFASCDDRGFYRLRGLPTGSFKLYTDSRERKLRGEASLKIDKEEIRHLDLSFPAGSLVSGRVTGDDGSLISGVHVRLSPFAASGYIFHATTADDGSFAFAAVPDGYFRLRGEAKGLGETDAPLPVQVAGQPVSGLRRQMVPGGVIAGRIQGLPPEEMARVSLAAYLLKGGRRTVTLSAHVDEYGFYRIVDAAPGTWLVHAGSTFENTREGTVELNLAGMTVGLDLDLDSDPENIEPQKP